jgi:DNA-binding response OmpR family regulator
MSNVLALTTANPGDLQNGLLALSTTMPQIQAVLLAEEADSALRIVAAHRPALELLDMRLPKQDVVLRQIKTEWPRTLQTLSKTKREKENE